MQYPKNEKLLKMPEKLLPNQIHMQSLKIFRKHELDIALGYFPPASKENSCRVLELGAGTGQQAKHLAELGYCVSAIDLHNSSYKDARVFPITEYNGTEIPFNNEKFDVIFSSNVLEHVVSIDKLLTETYRVLMPGGIAIHIIPSPACRAWSIPSHYICLAQRVLTKMTRSQKNGNPPRTPQSSKEWISTFFPLRHGERGNTFTETYYFSQAYWKKKFEAHGLIVDTIIGNGVFYTMANALGSALPLKTRRVLSSLFGSSCFIYITTKQ